MSWKQWLGNRGGKNGVRRQMAKDCMGIEYKNGLKINLEVMPPLSSEEEGFSKCRKDEHLRADVFK